MFCLTIRLFGGISLYASNFRNHEIFVSLTETKVLSARRYTDFRFFVGPFFFL